MILVESSILGKVTVMLYFPHLLLQYVFCHGLIETEVFDNDFIVPFQPLNHLGSFCKMCRILIHSVFHLRVNFNDDLWGYFYSRGTLESCLSVISLI